MGQSFYDSLIKMKFVVVLALAAMDMDMATHTDTDTMARDLLMLNPRLMLMPGMATTDMDRDHIIMDTEPMDMATHTDTLERDLLMLNPRPRLLQWSPRLSRPLQSSRLSPPPWSTTRSP